MRRRLGCLSSGGIIAAVVAAVVVGLLFLLTGGRLFSPGPLNAEPGSHPLGGVDSHAAIGGDCAACHPAPWSAVRMSDLCLDCHAVVAGQLDDDASLHGALQARLGALDCRECHPEHHGPSAPLTLVDAESFPHSAVGFSLTGHGETSAGEPFLCGDCHGADLTTLDPATCAECHGEIDGAFLSHHHLAFGSTCLDCHDGVDRYGAGFSHDHLAFPLNGQHDGLDCIECHRGARSPTDLTAAPGDCYGCHEAEDPHAGHLGTGCQECHSPIAWERVEFDHAETPFPLLGAHLDAECAACHEDLTFRGTPADCYACHAPDDAHDGRLGDECGVCHAPDGWDEASIDHSLTAFALTGSHADVECGDCHREQVFAGTPTDCVACHPEPTYHQGSLGTDCAACHGTAGWLPALFDQGHLFPLSHGDAAASPCRICHPDRLSAYTCYGCHEHDPAEIESEHIDEGISDFRNCVDCHPTGLEDEAKDGGDDD